MTTSHIPYALAVVLMMLGFVTAVRWLTDAWYWMDRRRHRPRLADLTTMRRPVVQLDSMRTRQAMRAVRSPEDIAVDMVNRARSGK